MIVEVATNTYWTLDTQHRGEIRVTYLWHTSPAASIGTDATGIHISRATVPSGDFPVPYSGTGEAKRAARALGAARGRTISIDLHFP